MNHSKKVESVRIPVPILAFITILACVFLTASVLAGQTSIEKVVLRASGDDTWQISTTLKHADTGWEHYADAWRVVIPNNIAILFIEAHDSVHGWNKDRVKIDMTKPAGERYNILR